MPQSELALSRKQLDAVLAYLPLFEHDDFEFGRWVSGGKSIPHYRYSPEAREFTDVLYEQGILLSGDWMSWSAMAERFLANPALLESADLDTIRRFLTVCVRSERVDEGHLGTSFESGSLLAALRRLKQLRDEHYGAEV
ncbi:MAG: DUF6508 domain-containing protein [Anaerolineales bacterium]